MRIRFRWRTRAPGKAGSTFWCCAMSSLARRQADSALARSERTGDGVVSGRHVRQRGPAAQREAGMFRPDAAGRASSSAGHPGAARSHQRHRPDVRVRRVSGDAHAGRPPRRRGQLARRGVGGETGLDRPALALCPVRSGNAHRRYTQPSGDFVGWVRGEADSGNRAGRGGRLGEFRGAGGSVRLFPITRPRRDDGGHHAFRHAGPAGRDAGLYRLP